MPKVFKINNARKADPAYGIEVGDTYYYWTFRYGGKRKSKTYPSRSQLTQSAFKQQMYEIEDRIGSIQADSFEDLAVQRDDLVGELESLRDECQDSLDNIPEQLQEGASGQLLQERIDGLESAINELESVDCDDDDEWDDDERNTELEARIEEVQMVGLDCY